MSIDDVTDVSPVNQYIAFNNQTEFDYSFPITAEADLVVYDNDTLQVLTTDYTVIGEGADTGGTITFVTGRTAGHTITLYRDIAIERTSDFQQNGPMSSGTLNDELDKITMILQQQERDNKRAIRMPVTATATAAQLELSPISNWLGKFLRISAAGILEAAEVVSSVVALTQSVIGKLLNPQTTAEAAADVTPVNYWYKAGRAKRHDAKGDGTTNDTAALLRMIAAMPASGGQIHFDDGAVYMIDSLTASGLSFSGKTNFKIFGNNSTLKVLDGQTVVGGFGMLYFTNCQDGYIENLVVDANRAGRTPAEVGAYNIVIQDTCARLHFNNVRSVNAVIDGWTLTSSSPASQATYPTDITLEDCGADNCYRNGCSVICSLRLTIDGGTYSNTNGTAPEDGIDVEPDSGYTSGNRDLVIRNVRVCGNNGDGITVTGPAGSPNVNVTIENVQCDSNDKSHIHVAQATNIRLIGARCGDWAGHASFGGIHFGDVSGVVQHVTISGVGFYGTTTITAPACLFINSAVTGRVVIQDVDFTSIDCPAIEADTISLITGVDVNDCSGSNPAILCSGARSILRNIRTDTTEAAGVYIAGEDVELDGIQIIDYGANASAGVQIETGATGSITRNVSVHQRTAIPASTYAIRYNGVAPRILEHLTAKSAGTDYTAANVVNFVSGTSGATIRDISPDPYRLATTWDPASIAAGAVTTQDFTITGAALLDRAYATIDSDLDGLILTADVSAANTVTVAIANNTVGAVDIGNSNVVVWVEKRA